MHEQSPGSGDVFDNILVGLQDAPTCSKSVVGTLTLVSFPVFLATSPENVGQTFVPFTAAFDAEKRMDAEESPGSWMCRGMVNATTVQAEPLSRRARILHALELGCVLEVNIMASSSRKWIAYLPSCLSTKCQAHHAQLCSNIRTEIFGGAVTLAWLNEAKWFKFIDKNIVILVIESRRV